MRISDWSSDVCSSDLAHRRAHVGLGQRTAAAELSENIAKPIAQTVEHAPQILVTRPATQNTPVSETSPTSGIRGQCFRRGRRYARTQNARGRGGLYTNGQDRKSTRLNSSN